MSDLEFGLCERCGVTMNEHNASLGSTTCRSCKPSREAHGVSGVDSISDAAVKARRLFLVVFLAPALLGLLTLVSVGLPCPPGEIVHRWWLLLATGLSTFPAARAAQISWGNIHDEALWRRAYFVGLVTVWPPWWALVSWVALWAESAVPVGVWFRVIGCIVMVPLSLYLMGKFEEFVSKVVFHPKRGGSTPGV